MDLVVGATGVVGKQIALGLCRAGRAVRAMVRGGEARQEAKDLVNAGIEVMDGDLTQPETLARACADVETVINGATSMPHGRDDGLRRVDLEGGLAMIDAAERAAVPRFVYVSYSWNLRDESPLETAKRSCENRLLASGLTAVVLRPSYFMEAWLSPALGFDPRQAKARVYGTGEGKVSYISMRDVVDFAVATTLKVERGPVVLELGGPEALSQLEVVGIFEETLGRKFALEYVPLEALRAQHASPDPLAKTYGALLLGYVRGDVIPEAQANAARFGIKLHSVAEYARTFRA
ncbi:MAG: NmrA family NAD(P)-binding protein [Acidobacteriia bacterium]|nr:NmrA family NAD(P)-binding protein [Terriglobia bacterium]